MDTSTKQLTDKQRKYLWYYLALFYRVTPSDRTLLKMENETSVPDNKRLRHYGIYTMVVEDILDGGMYSVHSAYTLNSKVMRYVKHNMDFLKKYDLKDEMLCKMKWKNGTRYS